ncbi:MAG: asparagine synthase C-terminal domain-containing protein [Methanomassiliicoccaceae archaeon]|nr:asparagine synthase C-terminal domain-containing protein [Methanomassiliicoccaceae archaeon]
MKDEHLVNELISSLEAPIRKAVSGRKVAIAFSGGLDSGIVAVLSKRHGDVMLYTVGVMDAYDVKAAAEMSGILGLPWRHLELTEDALEKELPEMIRMTGTVNPITLSFEVPLYFVLKHSDESIVLGGQGADELFLGYAKYVGLSEEQFNTVLKEDMAQLMNITLAHEHAVAREFKKTVVHPYLDEKVVDLVNRIGRSGVSADDVRKPLLRDAARVLGHPELAEKPKKSAQYGSGTMTVLRSMAKKRNMTVREMIIQMSGGGTE